MVATDDGLPPIPRRVLVRVREHVLHDPCCEAINPWEDDEDADDPGGPCTCGADAALDVLDAAMHDAELAPRPGVLTLMDVYQQCGVPS